MARRPTPDPEAQPDAHSALRDPVGPKPRNVYVRRRIFALLALVAIVAAIVLMIVRPGSNGGANSAREVAVPGDLSEKPKPSAAGESETPVCATSALEVTAVTNQGSYGQDEYPQLSLSVKNVGKDACVADLGTAAMSFTVSSGADSVWRSTDCQTGAESLPVILKGGELLESESIEWDRTRSSTETCDITRDAVSADGASYHLTASVGGADSTDTAQFLLY